MGVFDNLKKELIYYSTPGPNTACNANIHKLNVDTRTRTGFPICLSANPFPGTPPGIFENHARAEKTSLALDEDGRMLYAVTYHDRYRSGAHEPGPPAVRAWAINIDTGVVARLPDPPNHGNAFGKDQDVQTILWDSTHNLVIYPLVANQCGVLRGMYTLKPGATSWVSHPIVTSTPLASNDRVRGNGAVFDPNRGRYCCWESWPAQSGSRTPDSPR